MAWHGIRVSSTYHHVPFPMPNTRAATISLVVSSLASSPLPPSTSRPSLLALPLVLLPPPPPHLQLTKESTRVDF
ncbi:unnamed protein product [Closterium sp. NIES-54]